MLRQSRLIDALPNAHDENVPPCATLAPASAHPLQRRDTDGSAFAILAASSEVTGMRRTLSVGSDAQLSLPSKWDTLLPCYGMAACQSSQRAFELSRPTWATAAGRATTSTAVPAAASASDPLVSDGTLTDKALQYVLDTAEADLQAPSLCRLRDELAAAREAQDLVQFHFTRSFDA